MTKKYILDRCLSQFLTSRDLSSSISKLQDTLDEPIPLPPNVRATQSALRQAQKLCRSVVAQARDLAKQFQENRINAQILANPDTDPEKIAKKIKNQDAMRSMWTRIPRSKPMASGGITMVKIPCSPTADPKDPNTLFRTVVDPTEMKDLLIT
jgi:hypothetical protein